MRISTVQQFNTGLSGILFGQQNLNEIQEKIASGKKILSSADDPIASTQIVKIEKEVSMTDQFQKNVQMARGKNELSEGILGSVDGVVQRVRELAVGAQNPILNVSDYEIMATEVRQLLSEAAGLLNSQDGSGEHLYAGFQGRVTPFAERITGGSDYAGDSGQRLIEISASLSLSISDSGKNIFVDIASAENTIKTSKSSTNTGTADISTGLVVNQGKFDTVFPEDFMITFNDPELNQNRRTFTVTARSNGQQVFGETPPGYLVNVPYEEGQTIRFNGLEFFFQGTPDAGDQFVIESTANESLLNSMERFAYSLENYNPSTLDTFADTDVIGMATPGKPNANIAGNYVAAQTVTVTGPNGFTQSVSINAGDEAPAIVTALNTLAGVTASLQDTTATLDLSDTEFYENEQIQMTLNGVAVTATAGASRSATYTNVANAINAALGSATFTVTDQGDGTIDLEDTTGADIRVEDFAVTDFPRLSFDVQSGFDVGDTVSFDVQTTGGHNFSVSYVVAAGNQNDQFLVNFQADITAAGFGGQFSLTQSASGLPVVLQYVGDVNGNAAVNMVNFTDGVTNNAQMVIEASSGTRITDVNTQASVSTIYNGVDISVAAIENRATIGFQGAIGQSVTLLEGTEDSSRVAAQISVTTAADYAVTSNVKRYLGGVVGTIEQDSEVLARARFEKTVNLVLSNLSKAIDNVSKHRAEMGSRLNTLDSTDDLNAGVLLEHKKFLSILRDLDYAEAITELKLQTFSLEAAQQSFARISQLTLFNFL